MPIYRANDSSSSGGADIDDQGFPSLSVLSPSEYIKLRQALVRYFDESLLLSTASRLPSTFKYSINFSRPSYRFSWPKNSICLFLMSRNSDLSVSAERKISSFVFLSVHEISMIHAFSKSIHGSDAVFQSLEDRRDQKLLIPVARFKRVRDYAIQGCIIK
ncbi:hypothetical protein ElyMa_002288100 [Elysia marginata]|uniref:Uncharacterized protein n=1 Tax=Elysia marginata TaxID=1093978 RepID=A0AAV4G2E2_9GAST|nr:hypothetical protein ElyMa_002288100 [Elysia marginata]